MAHIHSSQLLPEGAAVRVGNQRGRVVRAELVDAHNGGKVALHTVKLTERFRRGFGSQGAWLAMVAPKTIRPNYSAIQTLD